MSHNSRNFIAADVATVAATNVAADIELETVRHATYLEDVTFDRVNFNYPGVGLDWKHFLFKILAPIFQISDSR